MIPQVDAPSTLYLNGWWNLTNFVFQLITSDSINNSEDPNKRLNAKRSNQHLADRNTVLSTMCLFTPQWRERESKGGIIDSISETVRAAYSIDKDKVNCSECSGGV